MKAQAPQLRLLGILACGIASAVLLVLAFPPNNYWFLAWVALVPMFLPLALPTPRPRAARAAAALTFVLYMGVLLWQAFPPGLTSRAWRGSDFPPILFLDSPALFVSVILLPTLFVTLLFCARADWAANLAGGSKTVFLAVAACCLDAYRVRTLPAAAWPHLGQSLHDATHVSNHDGNYAPWRAVAAHLLYCPG